MTTIVTLCSTSVFLFGLLSRNWKTKKVTMRVLQLICLVACCFVVINAQSSSPPSTEPATPEPTTPMPSSTAAPTDAPTNAPTPAPTPQPGPTGSPPPATEAPPLTDAEKFGISSAVFVGVALLWNAAMFALSKLGERGKTKSGIPYSPVSINSNAGPNRI